MSDNFYDAAVFITANKLGVHLDHMQGGMDESYDNGPVSFPMPEIPRWLGFIHQSPFGIYSAAYFFLVGIVSSFRCSMVNGMITIQRISHAPITSDEAELLTTERYHYVDLRDVTFFEYIKYPATLDVPITAEAFYRIGHFLVEEMKHGPPSVLGSVPLCPVERMLDTLSDLICIQTPHLIEIMEHPRDSFFGHDDMC